MKRSKPGNPGQRGVKHRERAAGRARFGAAANRVDAGWTAADEPELDETAAVEHLDSLIPPVTQVPALAARRRIEQLREEQWLHEALDDFPDG